MNEKPKNGRPVKQTERNNMIEAMYTEDGFSYAQIAKKTGLSKSRVRQLCNPEMLPAHDRKNYLKRRAKKLEAAGIEADKRKRARECGE